MIRVRTIALAGATLISAGPAGTLDETSLYGKLYALSSVKTKFRSGFDGMAVTNGNFLLSQENGELVFFGE